MSKGPPEGYVDVAARIRAFYDKFPEGRLRRQGDPEVTEIAGKTFVVYTALAYRDEEDKLPGMGTAWEPFPGPTPFTKDSELMNAETAAWGRAIASLGFEVHQGIATAEDVRNRGGDPKVRDNGSVEPASTEILRAINTAVTGRKTGQVKMLLTSAGVANIDDPQAAIDSLTQPKAEALVNAIEQLDAA